MQTEFYRAQDAFNKYGTPNKSDAAELTFAEVNARAGEMNTCLKVDSQRGMQYADVGLFYFTVETVRYQDFIGRHNLWSQFQAEDDEGKR